MDSSICNFLPVKNYAGSLKTVHFVYETQHDTLSQPFLRPIYYCYLVTGGQGRMMLHKKEYALEKGTLFFAFPGAPYEITGDPDFRYLYVSFMGPGAGALLEPHAAIAKIIIAASARQRSFFIFFMRFSS